MVFDHGVWLHNVRTDLVAPADLGYFAADVTQLVCLLLEFQHIQFCFQHLHCLVLILELGTLILACNHDAGRHMRDSDRR